ncbi:MAG: CheR family methyltransferase, partial [Bacteroidota bacterium]
MEVEEKDIRNFQQTIRDHSDYDFTGYSLTSLRRRLKRILPEYGMNMAQMIRAVSDSNPFLTEVVKKLTVHTTELFRDPKVWKKLKEELLPGYSGKPDIHIWHPGCSTGQEVYSMMMLLDELEMLEKTQIYATDINPDVLEIAREGKYKYHFNQVYLENFQKVLFRGSDPSDGNLKKQWKKYFTIDETRDL